MSKPNEGSERQMWEEWESFEDLLRKDLDRLRYRIESMYSGMASAGVSKGKREPFVYGRMCELMREITGPAEVKEKTA